MIRLRTLGSLQIEGEDGASADALLAQSRRIALLAYLSLATPRGFHRRDRLLALFWPEHDEQHARNALSQSVHVLRRLLGAGVIVSRADDELGLDWSSVWCDAVEFERALVAGQYADAIALYRGPLLDGFHVANGAPELDHWLEAQREHYAQRYAGALELMANDRERAGDRAAAVLWRRRAAAVDPFSSRAALSLMRALIAAGEPAQALQHARVHETLLREELGTAPDRAITQLVLELQASRPVAGGERHATRESIVAMPDAAMPDAALPNTGVEPIEQSPAPRDRPSRLPRVALLAGALILAVAGGLALAHARTTSGSPPISCLAVLPLKDLSRGATQDYLADGVTDAIITELARYERPTVISHTSTSRFKSSNASAREIARDLDCDGVVEGTVVRDGDRVRVAARLIHARTDRQLWSESYERDLVDLLILERQVAIAIATQVRAAVATGDSLVAPVSHHTDPVTYGIYLRGRSDFQSRSPASLHQALALFAQSVARDSDFALGYSGLSDTYRMLGGFGYAPLAFLTDSARRYAARALALDSSSSEAHTSLAALLTDDGDWPRAEAEYRRAIALRPGNAQAHAWYGAMLVALDRKEEAVREVRRAHDLDPLTQAIQGLWTRVEVYAGVRAKRDRAGERKGLVDPTHPGTIAARSVNLARSKRCPEAFAENRNAQALAPNVTMIQISLVGVYLLCGQQSKARTLLDSIERHPDARMMATYIASVHAKLGQRDSAFAWLERGQFGMAGRMELRMAPELDSLRSDPRFARVLHSNGMP